MSRLRSTFLALFLALGPIAGLVALAPAPAHAEGGTRAADGKVELKLKVVYATTDHERVDTGLERLKSRMGHFKYTGFEMLDTRTVQVTSKGKESFGIVGGRKVEVELLSKTDEKARMRLRVLGKNDSTIVDITFSVRRNGEYIVAGPRYKNGVLVLPVKASY